VKYPSSLSSNKERTYHLQDVPLESKTIDITFAIHRSRFVEFFVSPALDEALEAIDQLPQTLRYLEKASR
jgi:hypothetical protein